MSRQTIFSVMILYSLVYLLLENSIERTFVKLHVCADKLVGWYRPTSGLW